MPEQTKTTAQAARKDKIKQEMKDKRKRKDIRRSYFQLIITARLSFLIPWIHAPLTKHVAEPPSLAKQKEPQ
ncbi:MAG: hypothetical protein IJJ42_00545, partial [Clostridia bacterium]|nr:hypothetical protein [Clostridia bacterium]